REPGQRLTLVGEDSARSQAAVQLEQVVVEEARRTRVRPQQARLDLPDQSCHGLELADPLDRRDPLTLDLVVLVPDRMPARAGPLHHHTIQRSPAPAPTTRAHV